jgi:hypothetical protein
VTLGVCQSRLMAWWSAVTRVLRLQLMSKASVRGRLGAGICIDKRNPVIVDQKIGASKKLKAKFKPNVCAMGTSVGWNP